MVTTGGLHLIICNLHKCDGGRGGWVAQPSAEDVSLVGGSGGMLPGKF